MRCFAAVDVPEDVQERVKKLQKSLENYDVKLVEPHNLHFTMKFFGEVDEEKLAEIKSIMGKIRFRKIQINLEGIGVFPSEDCIHSLWIGTKNGEFINLHNIFQESFGDLFKKEKTVQHMTIARVRTQMNKEEIKEFVFQNRNINLGIFCIDKIKLKSSLLTKNGPEYQNIETYGADDE